MSQKQPPPPPKQERSMGQLAAAKKKRKSGTSFQQQQVYEKALKRHLTKSPTMAMLYEPYKSMGGFWELPYVCIENQCDQQRSAYVDNTMTRISHLAVAIIDKHTDRDMERIRARAIELIIAAGEDPLMAKIELDRGRPVGDQGNRPEPFSQKKWLIPHNGSFATRDARKVESERLGVYFSNHYTHMEEMRSLYADARAARENRHDMTDAQLQATALAMRIFADYALATLGKRRPHEERPVHPILTDAQMHQGGTIRVLAIDPGTTNLGLALVELVGMQAVPPGAVPVVRGDGWTSGEPEPRWRILMDELVDLSKPFSDIRGHAKLSYRPLPFPGEVMCPDYSPNGRITDYWKPVESLAAASIKKRARKKSSDAGRGTRTKRLKKVSATAETPLDRSQQQQQQQAGTLIDLTELREDSAS